MPKVFISYRREDSGPYAGRLADDLRERLGRDSVFMDIDTIEPGVDFVEVIQKAVGSCDSLVALIGDHWVNAQDAQGRPRMDDPDDFVRLEVRAALDRDIRVVPVLVHGASMPSALDLPQDLTPLARRNAMELSDKRWGYDVDQLTQVLRRPYHRAEVSARKERSGPSLGRRLAGIPRGVLIGLPAGVLAVLLALAAVYLRACCSPPVHHPNPPVCKGCVTLPSISPSPSNYNVGYIGSDYVIRQTNPNYAFADSVDLPTLGSASDGSVQFGAGIVDRKTDGRQVLVSCRDSSAGEYLLVVTPAAQSVYLNRTGITNGKSTSTRLAYQVTAIVKGGNAENRIGLTCVGDRVAATINGRQVIDVQDTSLTSGKSWIGVDTEIGTVGNVEGRFSNVRISKNPRAPTEAILLQDTFEDPTDTTVPTYGKTARYWRAGFTKDGTIPVYFIKQTDPKYQGIPSAFLNGLGSVSDAVVRLDARLVIDQPAVGSTAGRQIYLACRSSTVGTTTTNYRLIITPDTQGFGLYRYDSSAIIHATALKTGTSSAIRKGELWNHLELSCLGNTISASVNGQQVASVHDSAIRDGKVWFGTAPFASITGNVEAYYAHLQVVRP